MDIKYQHQYRKWQKLHERKVLQFTQIFKFSQQMFWTSPSFSTFNTDEANHKTFPYIWMKSSEP